MLEKKNVRVIYIEIIKCMCENAMTSVSISGGLSLEFYIIEDLHQGSALSLHLFALVIDEA